MCRDGVTLTEIEVNYIPIQRKGGMFVMLTMEGLIGLVCLCLACFDLGYRLGKHENEHKNNRPSPKK